MTMPVVWLIAMVALLIIEAVVPGLISIWFAIGALAALLSALVWVLAVSIAALVLTRPLAAKYVNARTQPTNADVLIGRECVVTETIDDLQGSGAVKVSGKVWTARTGKEGLSIEKGAKARILRIEGVKLIVEPIE